MKKENPIWCVPSRILVDNGGILSSSLRIEDIRHYISAVPRAIAENDTNWRQIIPYIVLTTPDHKNILRYRRGNKSGQKDLIDLYSIGFGGHVDVTQQTPALFTSDKDFWRIMARDAVRELSEELGIDNILHHSLRNKLIRQINELTKGKFSGFISALANKLENQIYHKLKTRKYQFIHRSDTITNKCHLGVCIVVEINMCEISAGEIGHIDSLAWHTSYNIRQADYSEREKLEDWSVSALTYATDLAYQRFDQDLLDS